MASLVIDEEVLVTEVVDEVVDTEDEEDMACPREIMSTAPTTLASKTWLMLTLCTGLPRTNTTMLVTAGNLTENIT